MKGSRLKYIDDDSDIEQDVGDDLKQIGVADEKDRDFIINQMKRIVKNGCFSCLVLYSEFLTLDWSTNSEWIKKKQICPHSNQKNRKQKSKAKVGDDEESGEAKPVDVWKWNRIIFHKNSQCPV